VRRLGVEHLQRLLVQRVGLLRIVADGRHAKLAELRHGNSVVSDTGFSYQMATPTAVPEPASGVLIALGLAGIAARQLRLKRRSGR
jgi:hypothetical protein